MKEDIEFSISTESLYDFIYNSDTSKKLELYKYLPRKRQNRLKQGSRKKRVIIPNRVSISKRDKVADEKTEIGYFEVDLTFHKNNRSANISVMIDKTSQKVILCFNRNKTSNAVCCGLLNRISSIPKSIRKTMIFDNGGEFANHINYHLKGFKTYFCDAYSPNRKTAKNRKREVLNLKEWWSEWGSVRTLTLFCGASVYMSSSGFARGHESS